MRQDLMIGKPINGRNAQASHGSNTTNKLRPVAWLADNSITTAIIVYAASGWTTQ